MNSIRNIARRLLRSAGLVGFLVALLGIAAIPAGATAPGAAPPGLARIWIYRDYAPYQSQARPYVRLNGAVAGLSQPGGAFYRDVPAGQYLVSVDSDGTDVNQFTTVSVVPGQTVYVQVQSSSSWDSGGGGDMGGGGYQRDTFYTREIPPEMAQPQIARTPLYGGS